MRRNDPETLHDFLPFGKNAVHRLAGDAAGPEVTEFEHLLEVLDLLFGLLAMLFDRAAQANIPWSPATLIAILAGAAGAIFVALSLALGLGAALGSWASGLLHDLTGGYASSFAMAATASACGLVTYWLSSNLRTERQPEI